MQLHTTVDILVDQIADRTRTRYTNVCALLICLLSGCATTVWCVLEDEIKLSRAYLLCLDIDKRGKMRKSKAALLRAK